MNINLVINDAKIQKAICLISANTTFVHDKIICYFIISTIFFSTIYLLYFVSSSISIFVSLLLTVICFLNLNKNKCV